MSAGARPYDATRDYEAMNEFLIDIYPSSIAGPHRSWLQPRWEYMHHHPWMAERGLDRELERCGVWEDDGRIVAAVHFEHRMGLVYIQLDPRYGELRRPLLRHAEEHLSDSFDCGEAVHVYLDDEDAEFAANARELGFLALAGHAETTSILRSNALLEPRPLPKGFSLIGLDEDDDLEKVHRVMHRGFDHPGEPREDELDARRRKLSAPNLRKDLTVVARAPDGRFASFCGMWLDPVNRVSYVEPVATDPDYRRMGLGTAVVLEGVRRCADEGATLAYVGSAQPFYLSMGFRPIHCHTLWRKIIERS
jgi:predicted N-acetyltransferase YhbS